MDPIFAAIINRLEALHQAIEKAIVGLPGEALVWSPGVEMNTLAVLLAHTFGAERYWIGDVAGNDPSGRVRETEFKTAGGSTSDFIARGRDVLAHSQSVLARLSPTELGDIRTAGNSGRQVSVAWALIHAVEHTALHTGHIEITRQLWEQRADQSKDR